jgi:cobalt-precorrin 5A hydrolase
MRPILAVGIGCRRNCSAEAVAALVRRALETVEICSPPPIDGVSCRRNEGGPSLFTSQGKASEPGLKQAAVLLDMEVVALPQAELVAAAPRCATRSARVEAVTGLPSLAEAAALAGAGPHSRLVLPRISENGVSCAVAQRPEATP